MTPRNQTIGSAISYNLRTDGSGLDLARDELGRVIFRLGEFASKDGEHLLLVHPVLVELLVVIRTSLGVLHLTSAFRSTAHNRDIGGAEDSRHLYGLAADVVARDARPDAVANLAIALGVGGVGRYDSFTHVDVFGEGRRWDKRRQS